MDVAERDHVVEAVFPPILIAAAPPELCGIFESAKEHVPDGQIREVVGVMTELMMNAMGLRALEKVTEPGRRLDVPVIEELADRDE
jgi:hypothetical protein